MTASIGFVDISSINCLNPSNDAKGLTASPINSRPKNREPKPNSMRPMLLILERLKKKIKNAPNAKIGIAYSPKSIPIINAVTVVPILAPIITPMACFNVINPAVTSPIVITVVPELLCIKIVTTIPAITPNTGFDVNLFKISRSLSPADA
ncbi:Uncharacterised protein [Staphylococcus aureus]|nr:Uncharacterised protein [Staphylococcus aureus]CPI86740.1 Uncharacterised protein [Staphylococcus aureus]CPJ52444.1 Uncharacterised protein [Staphylococcus aureus]